MNKSYKHNETIFAGSLKAKITDKMKKKFPEIDWDPTLLNRSA